MPQDAGHASCRCAITCASEFALHFDAQYKCPAIIINITLSYSFLFYFKLLNVSQWLSGPRSGVNPDDVDTEIGVFFRNLYRLEKTFNEILPAKHIAHGCRVARSA